VKRAEGESGASSVGLLLFVLVCSVAMWMGRGTPEAPPAGEDEEAEAVFQRTLAWVQRDAREWEREKGDRLMDWEDAKGHLVIVIDDVGRELDAHAQLQALRFPLTFSILPGSVYAAGAQLRLREDERRYREIWLHLPMEPRDAAAMREGLEAKEDFLLRSDDARTLRAKTAEALARVPAAVGVNNHMGSALTTDDAAMRAVLGLLRERNLLFVDSRTHHETVAAQVAAELGVPHGARQVFLDHDPDPDAMADSLREAVELAKEGPTIAIGHPSRALAAVLEQGLEEAYSEGVAVFPLSEHIARVERAVPKAPGSNTEAKVQSNPAP
jgi:polysaccharide deacetylase 2 family uncharacterized protein YibQ